MGECVRESLPTLAEYPCVLVWECIDRHTTICEISPLPTVLPGVQLIEEDWRRNGILNLNLKVFQEVAVRSIAVGGM